MPTHPGAVSTIFGQLAAPGVDAIVQSQPTGGALDISFTLAMNELPAAQRALAPLAEAYGWAEPEIGDNVSKVSIGGLASSRIRGSLPACPMCCTSRASALLYSADRRSK